MVNEKNSLFEISGQNVYLILQNNICKILFLLRHLNCSLLTLGADWYLSCPLCLVHHSVSSVTRVLIKCWLLLISYLRGQYQPNLSSSIHPHSHSRQNFLLQTCEMMATVGTRMSQWLISFLQSLDVVPKLQILKDSISKSLLLLLYKRHLFCVRKSSFILYENEAA